MSGSRTEAAPLHEVCGANTATYGGEPAESRGCTALSSGGKFVEPVMKITLGATAVQFTVGVGSFVTGGGIVPRSAGGALVVNAAASDDASHILRREQLS